MIVKVCGITNLEDALCAVDAGADMLGFIFYPPSPRSIRIEFARKIAGELRNRTIADRPLTSTQLVGVFVDETPEIMRRMLDECGLDLAQLSGNETPETLAAMRGRAYKAVRNAADAAIFSARPARPEELRPDVLLEADHPTLYGGSGERADDALAAHLARRHRVLLAGGLTPLNVTQAIRTAQPWGVDVASGVELRKGKKDHAKVRAFVRAAKQPIAA